MQTEQLEENSFLEPSTLTQAVLNLTSPGLDQLAQNFHLIDGNTKSKGRLMFRPNDLQTMAGTSRCGDRWLSVGMRNWIIQIWPQQYIPPPGDTDLLFGQTE